MANLKTVAKVSISIDDKMEAIRDAYAVFKNADLDAKIAQDNARIAKNALAELVINAGINSALSINYSALRRILAHSN